MLMRNKRGMSIALVLLVLATLVLTTFALFTFYSREKSIQEKIHTTRFLEDTYTEEDLINFYLQDIFDEAQGESEEEFVDSFKEELKKYKIDGKFLVDELGQVERQVEKIEVDEGKVMVEFQIELAGKSGAFSADYIYNKKFEKQV
jgi:hypothetical protein